MDFTKFISLLDTRQLFFARADKFDDPFEGSWPKANVQARQDWSKYVIDRHKEVYTKEIKRIGERNKEWRRFIAMNCWHANEHESAAMWKIYLKSDEGIAIQSTYKLLKESIIDEEVIYMGQVKYIDYETEVIQDGNILTPFVHKRKSFEYENEIRGLLIKWPKLVNGILEWNKETIRNGGIPIKVDVEKLIQKIHISPNAQPWFADLVESIIKKYGYQFEFSQSKLNESPLF